MSIAYELFKSIGKTPCSPGAIRVERCPLVINPESEDLFSSNFFWSAKYLHAGILVTPLLKTTFRHRIFRADDRTIPKIEFWKKLPSPRGEYQEGVEEVDIVITIRQMVILIECKFRSALQAEDLENGRRDQIARYLDAAVFNYWPDSKTTRQIYFILLTDTSEEPAILSEYRNPRKILENLSQSSPFLDYEAISHILAKNVGWICWKDLLAILEISARKRLPRIEDMIVKDLILYLKRKVGKE